MDIPAHRPPPPPPPHGGHDLQQDLLVRAQRMADRALGLELTELGFWLYLACFVLGVLLLLAWLFWPAQKVLTVKGFRDRDAWQAESPWRMRFSLDRLAAGLSGAVVLLLLLAVSMQIRIDVRRGFIADQARRMEHELRRAERQGARFREEIIQSHYMYLPEENSLRYFFLGNEALAADYLWLTSLQYVSGPFRRGQKFDLLHRFYQAILELEPNWVEFQVNAGKVLSALDPNRFRTEGFFQQAMTRNPEDWRLPIEAGRLWVIPPGDPRQAGLYSRKASDYFEQALLPRKRLPPHMAKSLKDLIGRLKTEAGSHAAAAAYLLEVARDKESPEALRQHASSAWLQPESQVRVDLWQDLVNRFHSRRGGFPATLQEGLREMLRYDPQRIPSPLMAGLAGGRPVDAYGYPIEYEARSGKVSSRGVKVLQAIQTARMIESLLVNFKERHAAWPKDLQELTGFVRSLFDANSPPPFTIQDALGADLDCTRNPLGEPWVYRADTGALLLPPDCDWKLLQQNQKMAMEGALPPYFSFRQGH